MGQDEDERGREEEDRMVDAALDERRKPLEEGDEVAVRFIGHRYVGVIQKIWSGSKHTWANVRFTTGSGVTRTKPIKLEQLQCTEGKG